VVTRHKDKLGRSGVRRPDVPIKAKKALDTAYMIEKVRANANDPQTNDKRDCEETLDAPLSLRLSLRLSYDPLPADSKSALP
jgi:hypothetical protein